MLWTGVALLERLTRLVMGSDVLHQLAREIRGRGEDPAGDHVALDLREPELDLVEPRTVGRRVVDLDPRVGFKPGGDSLGLMCREVVGDDVDPASPGLAGHQPVDEAQELRTRVP